jgi:methionyl aminopeptidase
MIKTSSEIEKIKKAGVVVHTVLDLLRSETKPGMTTGDLDIRCRGLLSQVGAYPTLLGYRGFPASICISVNEEIIHGVPGSRKINRGDLVSLDLAAAVEGYNADSAITFIVDAPETTPAIARLLKGTSSALMKGIAEAIPGNHIGDVSNAIQMEAEFYGLALIPEFGGHGVGRELHEKPYISNVGLPCMGELIEEGMTLAIEPMLLLGLGGFRILKDGWTVISTDNSLSAHFEHTIVVTSNGPIILT